MKSWIGVAIVAGVVVLAGPASAKSATAALPQAATQRAHEGRATDFSARRYYRSYSRPYYYARPYYYRPYPYYAPAPFTFGFGFGPFWW
jgi:hypothetical protein